MTLLMDEWQKEILNTKGNVLLCSGRQVGKSTIIAVRDGEYACNNAKKSILIISATERQAESLFTKILFYIQDNYPRMIKKGKDRPTKHIINLTNGSIIRCLPTGMNGTGIRGFTVDRLTVDEAAFIPESVWAAVTPMLLTTGGDIALLSTPQGKKGYFWECYNSPSFKVFHINSEECIKNRPISATWSLGQQTGAIQHLEREKQAMSALQYAQEYLGQFVDELRAYFPEELIKKCMKLKRPSKLIEEGKTYVVGMDIARLGDDETTFEIFDVSHHTTLRQVENIITNKQRLNETFIKVLELDRLYNFRRIYLDSGGIGIGIVDFLLNEPRTKNKTEPLNNRARPMDSEEGSKKRLLKEDLYANLIMLMERGQIEFLDDDEIFQSFKSVQYEYVLKKGQSTELRIFGNYTHIVEGIIRAAWHAKNKRLNIWVTHG